MGNGAPDRGASMGKGAEDGEELDCFGEAGVRRESWDMEGAEAEKISRQKP